MRDGSRVGARVSAPEARREPVGRGAPEAQQEISQGQASEPQASERRPWYGENTHRALKGRRGVPAHLRRAIDTSNAFQGLRRLAALAGLPLANFLLRLRRASAPRLPLRLRRASAHWLPLRLRRASSGSIEVSGLRHGAWLLLALCWASPALAQNVSEFLGDRVARIEVAFAEGQTGSDGGEYRQAIERFVRVGDPLAAEAVHESIEQLVSSGLASRATVTVAGAGSPDLVTVTYRITRQVRVAAIDFDDVTPEVGDELRGRLTRLDVGQRLTQPIVDEGVNDILSYYRERGYFDAQVRTEVRLDDTGTRATVEYAISPGEQARVSSFSVAVEGTRLPSLEDAIALDPGDPYTQAALEADLQTIRNEYLRAGYLAPEVGRPEVIRNEAAGTVAVEVSVVSGPLVTVAVEGTDLSQSELEAILPVYSEGGLDDFQLAEGDRRLADALQRKGYFFARVSHRLEGPPEGPRRVVYTVDRGRRFKVTDIDIEGTTELTHAEIQDQLRSREAGFFFLSRGLTSRTFLERDSDVIERRLRAMGFRKAQVVERRLGIAPDSDDLVITFVVEEGPRTSVADVAIRGNRVYSREELLADPAMATGEFYSDPDITTDVNAVLQHYADDGYISAEVTTELVELDQERVRLIYDVEEGMRARVADIRIAGNLTTKEESIRKYLRFEAGEIIRLEDLRLSERDLYNTNAFRQVIIRSEATGPSPDGLGEERTVFVDVEEAMRWQLIYGGGFNTDDGPRGIFEISNTNLFGRLNTGALRIRASRRQQIGEISYTNPIPFGYKLPALVILRYDREEKDTFDSTRVSSLLQVEKRLVDEPQRREGFFFRYNIERVSVSNLVVNPRQVERDERAIRLGRLSAVYYRDTRNNPFNPDGGQFFSLEAQLAARALGGNEQYTKVYGEYQRYDRLPKFEQIVYVGVAKFGLADPYGRSLRLPISERFFSGGGRTLRGFRFEEAGPRDRVTNQPVGGNALLVINNELRFPLVGRIGGAVFSDTGNVFRRLGDFQLDNLTQTVGVGLSFETPVGPIRIDVGYLLNPPEGVKGYAFHINFGQAF